MASRRVRDSQKEESWRRLIQDQQRSEASIRAWCRDHRVNEASFYWWRRELAQRDTKRSPSDFPAERSTSRDRKHSDRDPGVSDHSNLTPDDPEKTTTRSTAQRNQRGKSTTNPSARQNHRVTSVASSQRTQHNAASPVFVPVRISEDHHDGVGGRIEIVLTDGRRVRITGSVDQQMLRGVLAVLERGSC